MLAAQTLKRRASASTHKQSEICWLGRARTAAILGFSVPGGRRLSRVDVGPRFALAHRFFGQNSPPARRFNSAALAACLRNHAGDWNHHVHPARFGYDARCGRRVTGHGHDDARNAFTRRVHHMACRAGLARQCSADPMVASRRRLALHAAIPRHQAGARGIGRCCRRGRVAQPGGRRRQGGRCACSAT